MDEKNRDTTGYGRHPDMAKLAKELSSVTQASGKVGFAITYTATPGNVAIHEAFQKFCFERSNNEYLAGLGKLLEQSTIYGWLIDFDQRLVALESKEASRVAPQEKEEIVTKTVKTF